MTWSIYLDTFNYLDAKTVDHTFYFSLESLKFNRLNTNIEDNFNGLSVVLYIDIL